MTDPTPRHGIDLNQLQYACLAGTISEYNQWKLRHSIPLGTTVFISTTEVLHSVLESTSTHNSPSTLTFHQMGTFTSRNDALEILRVIRERRPEAIIYTDR